MFGGLFYYSIPLLFGKITLIGVVINQDINNIVYIIYIFAFVISFWFMYANDKKKIQVIQQAKRGYLNKLNSKKLNFVTIIIFSIFLIGVSQIGFFYYFFIATKAINDNSSTLIVISVVFSMIMLPLSLYYRKIIVSSVYFFILLSFFLYGVRSYFVVAIISSVFIFLRFKEVRLIKKMPLLILGSFFALSMAVFKFIFSELKSANISELVTIIKGLDPNLVMAQLLADPSAVVYNLNYTINNKINLSMDYFIHRTVSIIPGGGDFFSFLMGVDYPRYSSVLGDKYTNVHWGLASSLYAEIIAIYGFIGLLIVYIFINKLISNFNNAYKFKGLNFLNLIFISSFTYLLFYSHRLDITFILGIFKLSILTWIFFKYVFLIKKS